MTQTKTYPKIGMRVRLTRGSQNYYGNGQDSTHGEWIAARVPVGSVGTIYEYEISEKGRYKPGSPAYHSMLAVKFDGITEKEGYCCGLSGCPIESIGLEEVCNAPQA